MSKQPHYKYAAVQIEKVAAPTLAQPGEVHLHPEADGMQVGTLVKSAAHDLLKAVVPAKPERAHMADYLGLLHLSEQRLVRAFEQVRKTHPDEPDIGTICELFESWCTQSADALQPFVKKYGERKHGEPEKLDKALLVQRSQGGFDMLRDLHDLWLLVNESMISLDVLEQAARSKRDNDFEQTIKHVRERNKRQRTWLRTRIRHAASQVLVVPS